MLDLLKKEASVTVTENGALTYNTSDSCCIDLFFRAGAMRNTSEKKIAECVIDAFNENPLSAMKIIFFARDIRGGLGERKFFRAAIRALGKYAPEAVIKNIRLIAEYGRFDDLCCLLGTPCEASVIEVISEQLKKDRESMKKGEPASLLAKWLPSVNASSIKTRADAGKIAKLLGMNCASYRKILSALRKYTDIIENRLREKDYTFDYEKQPSGAMFKYRDAFFRNDGERYREFLNSVERGEAVLNTSTLYPYQIVSECGNVSVRNIRGKMVADDEIKNIIKSLDLSWKSLPDYCNGAENSNALVVVDGSGSMYSGGVLRPIDAAVSLGIYFAERNKGCFANHFITFSSTPRLVEIKGENIVEKVKNVKKYNDVADTNLEAVFKLILDTAVENSVDQSELPSRIYIISDMEFNYCVEGGNSRPLFEEMERMYASHGYKLPKVIFWNVCSHSSNIPVKYSQTGAALISGATPALFEMVAGEEISPWRIMHETINSERYAPVTV